MQKSSVIKTLTLTALFMALAVIATMIIRIPTPLGYINIGDSIVLLAGFTLGPIYGALAGGIGSALADILGGYPFYAPATLIIKFLMPIVLIYSARAFKFKTGGETKKYAIGAILAELVMVGGYFIFEATILAKPEAALVSVVYNAFQAIVSIAIFLILKNVVKKIIKES